MTKDQTIFIVSRGLIDSNALKGDRYTMGVGRKWRSMISSISAAFGVRDTRKPKKEQRTVVSQPAKLPDTILTAEVLNLNIGSGSKRKEGYINVDIRADLNIDIVSSAWDLPGVAASSVSNIYSRHMLEHLDPTDARKTLQKWFQVLRPRGRLNVVVPDIEFHAKQLLGIEKSTFADQEQHMLAGFYGWRNEAMGGNREDAHRWGYVERTLTNELAIAGFTRITRQKTGIDSEPWHLNMLAEKA
jgi:SAM-dependent methyltransferase